MSRIAITVGPLDHGRPMTLEEFDHAEVVEGHLYELGRGIIVVSDVPDRRHLAQVQAARLQLTAYHLAYPGRIHTLACSGECKILLADLQSERHPDLAIYRSAPLGEEDLWATWIPDILIEVVSARSEYRDYVEKREEYLLFGVREYWILNAERQELLVLTRVGGRWKEDSVRPPDIYRTRLLPGFEFNCAAVFQAAAEAIA